MSLTLPTLHHMAGMKSKLAGILAVGFNTTKFKYFSTYLE